MLNRTEIFIRTQKMLLPGSRVLCAVSGGADSVCLLAALYELREKLGITLLAAHYNHQLRGSESDRDENFVRALVQNHFPGVALTVGRGNVALQAKQRRTGLEETAREMRYAFLQQTARAQNADRIATAHTADDNAETVLLHLARGTGLQGMTGISPVRGNIIRPLLTASRQEVEAFLLQKELPHVEDSSNSDEIYARNRVRHQVVPVLEGLYPGFARRLTENAAHLRADADFLNAQAEELTAQACSVGSGVTIPVGSLIQAPGPVAVRAVRSLLARLRSGDDTCAASHLEAVLDLCRSEKPSGEVHLPGGILALREYETLKLIRSAPNTVPEPISLALPGETRFGVWRVETACCVYGGEKQSGLELWLSQEKAGSLTARTRREGDGLKLPGRPAKSLKKWLIDLKIPRRDRDALPVLTVDGQPAAAALLGPDINFIPAPGELSWHIVFSALNDLSDG